MRISLRVGAYLALAITVGSVLGWLLHSFWDIEYGKVLSRTVLLFAAIGLVPLWRMLGYSAVDIGLSPVDIKQAARALPYGLIIISPIALFFVVVGFRVPDPDVFILSLPFFRLVLVATVSACLVAVFEETLFRGLFYSAMRRRSIWVAVGVTSTVYSAVHFLQQEIVIAADQTVAWWSGWIYVGQSFSGLSDPSTYWDSFLGLALLGVLLCLVRERFGLWACIGLHAIWVFVIRVFKELMVRDVVNPYRELAGTYDNFVGLAVVFWLCFVFVIWALLRRYEQSAKHFHAGAK